MRGVGDSTRFGLAFGGGLALAALLGWGVWRAVLRTDARPPPDAPRQDKVFRRTLMENLRVTRHGVRGVDFVRCGVCRLEKRKRGALTFGGMNVLVLEDLDVVLPPAGDDRAGASAAAVDGAEDGRPARPEEPSRDVIRRMGISDDFLAARGIPFRFSGVRVARLTLNRLQAVGGTNAVARVLSARSAEAARDGLALTDCRLTRPGDTEEFIGRARLTRTGGALRLVWPGGAFDIP